ncbi:helix-turn-helix transcriptional regulator [Alkalibacterium olivapovliticus]|uniref:AraC-like protein n=1 Tax=Alkalibacterium olivapovliticus TaxID=99907 RepID=A0A2T0WB97_9LACT|nr:AraC family transcriptional regulator [Alkalibacterium olivapovliticus]PRY83906.1 AraC-like protein [Alkalibacterium olivapovliticus]
MYFFEKHGLDEKQTFNYSVLENISFPLHFHRAYEIILVESGEMSIKIEEMQYTLRAHEAVFIFPNQLHELVTVTHSVCKLLIFSPEMVGQFYSSYKRSIPINNQFTILFDVNETHLDTVFAQKSLLYNCCDALIKQTSFEGITLSPQRKIIQNILLYVDTHYANECTLKTAAQTLQYDYAYLSKLFYQYTQLTFTDYLNRYRITQATYYLENTELTIKEIAHSCGYNNLRTFNRNFRQYKASSPSHYRKNL